MPILLMGKEKFRSQIGRIWPLELIGLTFECSGFGLGKFGYIIEAIPVFRA